MPNTLKRRRSVRREKDPKLIFPPHRRGGSRRSLNGSFDSDDYSDLLEDETEAGSDLTPSNVLFTVRGQKVAGFAVCEAKSSNRNSKTDDDEEEGGDWEIAERRTTGGKGQVR